MAKKKALFLPRSQSSLFKMIHREFDSNNLTNAINLLSYGTDVVKHGKKNAQTRMIIYISEENPQYLQYIKQSGNYDNSQIPLLDIYELRDQPTNEKFKNLVTDQIIQISYGEGNTVLQFRSKKVRDLWWQGVQYFIDEAKKVEQQMAQSLDFYKQLGEQLLKQVGEVKGESQLLRQISIIHTSFTEIKNLIQQMYYQKFYDKLQTQFNLFDVDNSGSIRHEDFQKLVKVIMNYEQLKPIYKSHAKLCRGMNSFEDEQGLMTKGDFHHFITSIQRQSITKTELNDLFDSLSKESDLQNSQRLISFSKFIQFLVDPTNSAFDEEKSQVYQDMTRPLTDYYINSSHNTYLMSNQLTGTSSIQAYINAFQKGCRCVELDCWNGPNGEPIVYHGYTMTTKITFESVIKTINEYAFKYSPYPLILSLEVHCGLKQQSRMADIINTHLHDQLLLVYEDWDTTKHYPSPETLQNKIILKGKGNIQNGVNYRLEEKQIANELDVQDFESPKKSDNKSKNIESQNNKKKTIIMDPWQNCDIDEGTPAEQSEMKSFKTLNVSLTQVSLKPKYKQIAEIESATNNQNDDEEESEEESPKTQNDQAKPNAKESIKLVAITAMFGITMNLNNERSVWQISSLEEKKLAKLFKNSEKTLIDFHKKYFTRIYPAGKRVDSSNYDPIKAFIAGSQIVALNFQTLDMPMLLNYCKFQENGGMEGGYLLKPKWMLSHMFASRVPSDFTQVTKTINIHIIFGQNLQIAEKDKNNTSDIIDPYVKMSIRGTTSDELQNPSCRSMKLQNNGLNPKFDFKWYVQLRCSDLAMLVFEVNDEHTLQDRFIGWSALSISCLRQGYRNIQLLNKQFKPINNSLLFASIQFDQL